MNIAVSGLAAAGKTTHARLLARWLDFDYVSADESWPGRMRFVQGVGVERHGAKTDGDSSVEVVINTLVDALRTRDRTVFDSWAAPWLPASVPCIRVWIESTLDSRAGWWRAAQEPYGPRPALETAAGCFRRRMPTPRVGIEHCSVPDSALTGASSM